MSINPLADKSSGTVLLVEDDAALLRSMERVVERDGFKSVVARDRAEVLFMAKRGGFECCVVDYRLADCDGLEVARELRAAGVTSPVILISGNGRQDFRDHAAAVGVDDVLMKPFTTEDFRERVRRAFAEAHRDIITDSEQDRIRLFGGRWSNIPYIYVLIIGLIGATILATYLLFDL